MGKLNAHLLSVKFLRSASFYTTAEKFPSATSLRSVVVCFLIVIFKSFAPCVDEFKTLVQMPSSLHGGFTGVLIKELLIISVCQEHASLSSFHNLPLFNKCPLLVADNEALS